MEQAPIPPHERPWRHPSELGPTSVEVASSGHTRAAVIASGTLAVVLVAAMVVAMTPRTASNPIAVGVTSAPTTSVALAIAAAPAAAGTAFQLRSPRLSSFTAIPNAIAAVPRAADAGASARVELPDLDDFVVVITDEHLYQLLWRDVASLSVPDAMVVSEDGSVVAEFIGGNLVVATDSKVGAALALSPD